MATTEGVNIDDDILDIHGRTTETSSVGSTGFPPIESSFNRLKSVDTQHIDNETLLRERLEYVRNVNLSEDLSRVTLRVFISNNLIPIIQNEYPDIFEGIISLNGCGISELDNSSIIYLGRNLESRTPSIDILESQVKRAREIFNNPKSQEKQMNGLNIRELTQEDKSNPEIIQMYYELNSTFGWTYDQAKDMLNNPDNKVIACFAIENGRQFMAGSGIAEMFEFTVQLSDGKTVSLKGAELTEATTDPTYQGRGIYRAISNVELRALAQANINIAFAESNLDSPSVLTVGNNQSRILGLPVGTTNALRYHVTVGGVYENFAPTYIVQNDLIRMFTES